MPGSGVRLHCRIDGNGPTVLLLHGFPESSRTWDRQMAFLAAQGFRAIAPDLRGYGESDKPRGIPSYALDLLVDDIRSLVEGIGGGPVTLVGHDWGGIVAWHVAMRHPELLSRLAILNVPHPGWVARLGRFPRQWLRSWYVAFFQLPWLPELLARAAGDRLMRSRMLAEAGPDAFSEEQLASYAALSADPAPAIHYYRAWMRSKPWKHPIRRIDLPTLVLWGERDRYLGRELAVPEKAWVPDCDVRFFPASHWLQNERPDDVNAALLEFLRRP